MEFDSYCVLSIFVINMYELFLRKIKYSITITNVFQKILDETGRHGAKTEGHKPKKIWGIKAVNFIIQQ